MWLSVQTVNCVCVVQEFETNGSYDTEKSRTTGSVKTKLRFQDKGRWALIRIIVAIPPHPQTALLLSVLFYKPQMWQPYRKQVGPLSL